MLFAQKSKDGQGQLPPTLGSLVPHTARAYHMALIWKTSKEPCPQFPPPTDYFWELVDGRLKPVYCTNLPAPETLLELRKCSCKTGCTKNSCGCKKNNLKCTDMCGCGELCQNIYHESTLDERADIEWKFARSKLWMSYFEEGGTAPPPFNIIPTPKSLYYLINWCIRQCCIMRFRTAKKEHLKTIRRKAREVSERNIKYQTIMRNLVRRYVTAEQRKSEHAGVTEDDVNEVKQDISSFRYELIEILKNSGMNTSSASGLQGISGKKNRQKERRLMKGFNIGLVEETFSYPDISSELVKKSPMNRRPRFARLGASTKPEHKRHHRWGHIVEAAKTMKSHLARSRSEDSIGSHSSHSQVTVGDGTSNSNGSDLSIGDVEIIPDAIGPERRRLRFWKENSTSTDTPEPKVHDDNDLAACESGMLNRRFAVLALNPAKLRASMEQYQKRMEREKMCAKTQAKRTSSAPSDNQGFSVRFKRRSKKSEEIETPKLAAKNLSSVVYSPDSTPNTPSPMCPSDDVQAVTAFGDRAAEQLRNPRNEVSSPDSEVSDDKLVTSESQEPLVSNALNDQSTNKQSNGSALALARTHGIQPINRQMSAGWL
ncbi:Transient receptor potential-gamma protein [Nymphon striatum]|nr:Transient receptor potential-gamma protein [Nymphon striatum]